MCGVLHRFRTLVAVFYWSGSRLWRRLGRTLLHREEQTSNVPASALVFHGRLQNDLVDVDRENGCGGATTCARWVKTFSICHFSFLIFHWRIQLEVQRSISEPLIRHSRNPILRNTIMDAPPMKNEKWKNSLFFHVVSILQL